MVCVDDIVDITPVDDGPNTYLYQLVDLSLYVLAMFVFLYSKLSEFHPVQVWFKFDHVWLIEPIMQELLST